MKIRVNLLVIAASCWGTFFASAQTNLPNAIKSAVTTERPPGGGNGLGPLEAELLKLQRAPFETPEARQQAIRQWHIAHGAPLKAEIDARREAGRPERERQEAEIRVKADQNLNDLVADKKIDKLEAELIKLTRTSFDNPEQHRAAMERWRGKKGAAFEAEREERRAREAPRIAALQAESLVARQQQIDAGVKNGSIGPREAELMKLHQNPAMDPVARNTAVQKWIAAHGAELKAEHDARRQRMPAETLLPAAPGEPAAP